MCRASLVERQRRFGGGLLAGLFAGATALAAHLAADEHANAEHFVVVGAGLVEDFINRRGAFAALGQFLQV